MRFFKQWLQALLPYPIFLPDTACPGPTYSIIPTDREPGTGYEFVGMCTFFQVTLERLSFPLLKSHEGKRVNIMCCLSLRSDDKTINLPFSY